MPSTWQSESEYSLYAPGHGAADEPQAYDAHGFHCNASLTLRTFPASTSILIRREGLGPVAQGVWRVVVHFDHQPVRTGRRRRQGHGLHQPGLARGVAGVYDHRQMGQLVQHGHGGKIQRVAGVGFKGANAPLAEDHPLVAARS